MDKMMTSSERTNQTLDKHVSDSTDSDNEEKEDGELEEGEVEEEFDEMPQQKDDAKENNRDNNTTNDLNNEADNTNDVNNHINMGSQKYRRREYHHHLGPPRLNSAGGGQQDKRIKHEQRRKRRHSGEDRDERNQKSFKRGRFRGRPMPDLPDDGEDDEMMGQIWPPRGQNRGQQRKQQSDNPSNENSESIESGDPQSSSNPVLESKSEQSMMSDETSSPIHDLNDDENMNSDDKQDRPNRSRMTRNNQQQNSMTIENRGRRYYDGNSNPNNNSNNRRLNNDRDRSSWQDRNNNNSGNNSNSNTNQRFRSDQGSSTNHGPPLCKFFVENRCMKGNDCLFSHDYKPQKKMEICKYYVQNKGYCQKNDSCPYLHGEFPCKFFHTGQKVCMQGERCKFSHDAIVNDDIRFAFERFLNDSDEMNRQNRGNSNNNNNIHHNNNPSSVNFEVMNATSLPPPPPTIPGSLPDPSNFPMIPNLMDLFLLQNGRLPSSTSTTDPTNTDPTAIQTTNPSQSSPPMQRPSLFTDTLSTEKADNEESIGNKTVSTTNSTSPSSSSTSSSAQNTTSNNDSASTTTVTSTNTTSATATATNSTCPLPLPPVNTNLNLPSPFGRLPQSNMTRPTNSLLPPPPPPNLFPMNTLGTGRVPILFPTNNGLPMPPPPGPLLDMKLLAQAAALAAVANQFTAKSHHHQSQSSSPQLGRDIDERDRQSTTTMRGDIDERPSDVYNRPTTNLGLLQTASPTAASSTPTPSTNLHSPTSSTSPPSMIINDEQLKNKTTHDIFRTTRPTSVDTLSTTTPTNPTVGPSFDFISMLEQLKQPKQAQVNDNSHDSLEIRTSSSQSFVYILRPVVCSFKPYYLPDKDTDPRIQKYQEKMSQWSEQARLEHFKTTIPSSNNYSLPLRTQQQQQQQQTSINDATSSRDPRLLRNSAPSNKIGVPIISTSNPFIRPNDNFL